MMVFSESGSNNTYYVCIFIENNSILNNIRDIIHNIRVILFSLM